MHLDINEIKLSKMSEKLYKIVFDRKYGRQLIASRDIKAGECIISEPPIIHSPGYSTSNNFKDNTNSLAYHNYHNDQNKNPDSETVIPDILDLKSINVCIVCYQNQCEISTNNVLSKCDICSLYMCSETCCSNESHTMNECKILQNYPISSFPNWKCLFNFIAVIRCLYCRFRDKVRWKQITALQSKKEELESLGAFLHLDTAFNFLNWNMFGESNLDVDNDLDTDIVSAAKHSLGVMRINAFSHFSGSWSREGLYFLSSLMSHSCVMNTDRQMDQDGKMIVRAAVDIEEGESITTSYTNYLSSNIERKLELEKNWLFSCDCRRCLDPAECGTFLSNICCPNCEQQTLQPFVATENDVEENIISEKTHINWKCSTNSCDSIFPNSKALEILQIVENAKPKSLDSNHVEAIQFWLQCFASGKFLHKNHSLFAQVKFILCQLIGREKEGCGELISSQLLIYKAELCCDLLSIFKCLYPGVYQFRGVILFELWNCINNILLLSQTEKHLVNFIQDKGWSEKYIQDLKTETIDILSYACPNSPEESMALVMQENL